MGKFKVGDRVRLTEDNAHWGVMGDTATVKDVFGLGRNYWLEFDREIDGARIWCCPETHLELIEPDAATTENWDFDPRRELKVGDRVRALRDDGCGGFKAGDTFVIDSVIGRCIQFVDNDGDGRTREADGFALVPTTAAAESDADLSVRVVADMSQLDGEIDRILRRLKKVEKKARKLGIRLEFRDAA